MRTTLLIATTGLLLAEPSAAQVAGHGLKVGDTVSVPFMGAMTDALVLRVEGNAFYVRLGRGTDIQAWYPGQIRRRGRLTAFDHANGQFDIGERVQVLTTQGWTEGTVKGFAGAEYQVDLAGNREAWARPEHIRFVAYAPDPAVKVASTGPPRPGFVRCAGKLEGRYASDSPVQITIRAGTATISLMGASDKAACWTNGSTLVLVPADTPEGLEIDINDDGSLQTWLGQLKKVAK